VLARQSASIREGEKMKLAAVVVALMAFSFSVLAQDRTPAPEGARAYIISPQDGATVSSPVTVIFFGLRGWVLLPLE
jgi:hypothetical protein